MFAQNIFFVPGQELREFTVLRLENRETENGRIVKNSYMTVGKINAILAQAKPAEIERWRQLQYPVTHKIIQQGKIEPKIKENDILEYGERRFHIQAKPYNIGDLGHWTIYYCEERSDV